MKLSTPVFIVLAILLSLNDREAHAQFAWDGECGFNWAECCNFGTPENPEYRNNWAIAPSFTSCPDLPGHKDDVSTANTVLLAQPYLTHVKSLTVNGTFLLKSELKITDHFTLSTLSTVLMQNGPAIATIGLLSPSSTLSIPSFATLDFQFDGSIYGSPTGLLSNNGQILKSVGGENPPPYESQSLLHIPVENYGTITAMDGKLVFDHDTTHTKNAVIEVFGESEIRFQGPANFLLDGEVRGDGLIRFLSTYSGGAAIITGDYNPTNTVIAGGYATVNFDVGTSIENLTLGNSGIVGGAANLIIDDFLWNGGYSTFAPSGTTIVQDTMLIQYDSFAGGSFALNRDMELHGESVISANAQLAMNEGELRNYGQLQMHGNSSIAQPCCAPNSLVQNFGTLRRTGGGAQSGINVTFLNSGNVNVESGSLNFDGEMTSDGPITLSAGTTLYLGHKQQTNFLSGSITGEGAVYFYNDFWSGDTTADSMLGEYNVGSTTIQAGVVSFDTDGIIAPQKTIGTLNLIQGFGETKLTGNADIVVTDQLNWSSGDMDGSGTTFVHGPMILNNVGYWQSLSRTLELNVDAPPSKQPPSSTLAINPQGTLNCKNVTIDGHVNNNGLVSPGTPAFPVAQLHLTGSYTQTPAGKLTISKLGPVHDQLIVDGSANLNGTLNVTGFPASGGQLFTILSAAAGVQGAFAQVNAPTGMEVIYTATSVILQASGTPCSADIAPSDGVVNVDDLLAVINAWGACADPSDCPADVNNDDMVNVDDLLALINAWGRCP